MGAKRSIRKPSRTSKIRTHQTPRCNQYSCNNPDNLRNCRYCGKLFCKEHIKAKPTGMPRFQSSRPEDLLFMEEYNNPLGHPCPDYVEKWEAEQKLKTKQYMLAMDNLSKPNRYEPKYEKQDYSFEDNKIEHTYNELHGKPKSGKKEHKHPKKHYGNKNKNILFKLWPLWLVLIIIAVILFCAFSTVTEEKTEIKEGIIAVKYNDSNISFKDYLDDLYAIDGKEATIKGLLKRTVDYDGGNSNFGMYIESVIDDYENQIKLLKLTSELRSLFPDNGVTEAVYDISGKFKRNYKTLEFEVYSITLSKRTPVEKERLEDYSEEVIVTISKPRFPAIQPFVFNLIGKEIYCDDGTLLNECSETKPFYCGINGLTENPEKCGCPEGYTVLQNSCVQVCNDGTVYGTCSKNKPKFCDKGVLLNKASICGCPTDYVADGEICVSKYQIGPKTINLEYIVKGKTGQIEFVVYKGLDDYVSQLPRSITYTTIPPTKKDFILRNIDNSLQREYIFPLVEEIKSITSDKDQQAKIAISLVQKIPYDWSKLNIVSLDDRYAYQVLYDKTGVCGEKSELLALILRDLGFGVALFNYESENHQALGIKCAPEYDYLNSGYCFVETSSTAIITNIPSTYVGVGELKSTPEIIVISSGLSLEDIEEEYNDAILFEQISNMGPVLNQYYYSLWWSIVNKYGIELDTRN